LEDLVNGSLVEGTAFTQLTTLRVPGLRPVAIRVQVFDQQGGRAEVEEGRLRSKIDRGFPVPLIQTIRGSGYRLHEP
jgi:hypothetical protein